MHNYTLYLFRITGTIVFVDVFEVKIDAIIYSTDSK